jgi:hypothetical protein
MNILAVPLPFICRLCQTETTVYCSPRETEDGALGVDPEGAHRIATARCETCETERVHVIDRDRLAERTERRDA